MSSINILSPDNYFGFSLHYKSCNESKSVKLGRISDKEFELEINLKSSGKSAKQNRFKHSLKENPEKITSIDCDTIANETLVVRFSINLFCALLLLKSKELDNPALKIVSIAFFNAGGSKERELPIKYNPIVDRIIDLLKSGAFEQVELCANIYSLFGAVIDLKQHMKSNNLELDEQMADVIEYIHEHEYVFPSSRNFIELTGYHRTTFVKAIKKITKQPVSFYVGVSRSISCLWDIIFTNKQFREISMDHGYADQSSFNRRIKLDLGLTPNKIRSIAKVAFINLLTR